MTRRRQALEHPSPVISQVTGRPALEGRKPRHRLRGVRREQRLDGVERVAGDNDDGRRAADRDARSVRPCCARRQSDRRSRKNSGPAASPAPRYRGTAGTGALRAARSSAPGRAVGRGLRPPASRIPRPARPPRAFGQPHVVRFQIVRRREISPRQRSLLTVGLAERHREAGARQLLAQVEGVRRFPHLELREDVLDVGAADEALMVQHGDPLAVGEDAEIGVRDARLQRAELVLGEREHRRDP